MKFRIFAGLKGKFGGANSLGVYNFEDKAAATNYARTEARDLYEIHVGQYGIRSLIQIMSEEGVKQETAEIIWLNEMNDLLDYRAESI